MNIHINCILIQNFGSIPWLDSVAPMSRPPSFYFRHLGLGRGEGVVSNQEKPNIFCKEHCKVEKDSSFSDPYHPPLSRYIF